MRLFELLSERLQGRLREGQLVAGPENIEIAFRDPQHQLLAGESELRVCLFRAQVRLLERNPEIATVDGLREADVRPLGAPVRGAGGARRPPHVGVVVAHLAAGADIRQQEGTRLRGQLLRGEICGHRALILGIRFQRYLEQLGQRGRGVDDARVRTRQQQHDEHQHSFEIHYCNSFHRWHWHVSARNLF